MSPKISDFKTAALLGTCLARDYAPEALRLLALYRSLSASELASRLDMHIQTAQDFLEALSALGITGREEVLEKKRPYYRYSLRDPRLRFEIDLAAAFTPPAGAAALGRIREKKNAAARFDVGRDNSSISHVAVWTGGGRERRERKINLTRDQGRFLFRLPFPSAQPESVDDIMKKAGVEEASAAEILDLLAWLEEHAVIERFSEP
jgi:hypothetical protein